jgi:integrase
MKRFLSGAEVYLADEPDSVWFSWLYAYSGARPEELAQLAPDDVREYQGINYFRIHDEGQNNIKNEASYRVVPVHAVLLNRGFLEFVRSKAGRLDLFNNTEPDSRGRRYSKIAKRLTRLIDSHLKIDDPRAVPYSVRHAFKDCFRMIGAPEAIEDRIMGHTTPDRMVAEGYGNPDQLPTLKEWMDKIDPLDLHRVAVEL